MKSHSPIRSSVSRRQFLKTTAASATVLGLSTQFLPAHAQGANERVGVAVIGLGGQGNFHAQTYQSRDDAEVLYVVDADRKRAEAAKKRLEEKFQATPRALQEVRQALEDASVDAISIATCNHWHALMTVWGCQAGKHVYVEKPCSHTLWEGRQCVNAAKKYKVCVQHGTQRRSEANWYLAAAAFRSGKYGKPTAVEAFAHRPRTGLGFKPTTTPPESLDWNLWVGPSAMQPYHGNLVPYNWHWFWNFGNGEIGNNGPHHFDMCRLALGDPHQHPTQVFSWGTRVWKGEKGNFVTDQAQTPNVQAACYLFGEIPCYFAACNLRSANWIPRETAFFHTDEGYVTNEGGPVFVAKDGSKTKIGTVEGTLSLPQPGGAFGNFLQCVKENAPEKLNAPIEEGHYSTAMCHLGNLSYRLGRKATWEECCKAMNNEMRERAEAILDNVGAVLEGCDVRKELSFVAGETISISNETETFSQPQADALLTKPPREPFAVPEVRL